MTRRIVALVMLGACAGATSVAAQSPDSAARPQIAATAPTDSFYLRARKLVLEGNGAAGRALIDSAIASTAGTPEYATALYWRGALSSTASDAERDYRRVIVEYPFSRHSGDALLALAQLEMARGDREPAIDHLQRFLLQRPNDPDHVRAGIWLGRLLLDQNQLARGCAVLLRTRASLGDTAIEVRNQVDYYASRCTGVDTVAPPRAAAVAPPPRARIDTAPSVKRAVPKDTAPRDVARRPTPARDTSRRDSTKRIAKPRDTVTKATVRPRAAPPNESKQSPSGRYTVQVAAYDTRDAAEQLVNRLSARGITARVVASASAPYRVRVGRYATDAAATVAARELKEKGIVGFVTTTDNESAGAPARR